MGLILKALNFAAHKHRNQRRKDIEASPYINHPITLAHLLWNIAGVTDVVAIAGALLHDTVEDTETTFEELEQEFGWEVQQLVREVTDDKSLPKEKRKQLQIEHAPSLSQRAKLVKLADKISNLRDIIAAPPAGWSAQRKRDYFEWAKSVVDGLRGTHEGLELIFDEVYQESINKL
ncbi:MAG TPA: phosphohydrolase [Cyanobacteria bacterium UBA8803]|nr:phosphohydrolase [Cyanobacteria bacterium UBA9273]HBL61372.1 phosphohydrolase [Cyanobacteria bacterium UBA8803]